MKEFIINGEKISDFYSLINEFNEVLFDSFRWNGNLDSLNDLLRGGFGNKADTHYKILWKSHSVSKANLGYKETEKWLCECLKSSHISNHIYILNRIENLKSNNGLTLFDEVIEIIKNHGEGGEEYQDGIVFELL